MDTERPWEEFAFLGDGSVVRVDPVGTSAPADLAVVFDPNALPTRDALMSALKAVCWAAVAHGRVS